MRGSELHKARLPKYFFCLEPNIYKKSCCSLARTSSTHTEQVNLCAEAFHWETPLQIIQYPDPRLRAENTPITTFDSTLEAFAADMFQAMYDGWVPACIWGPPAVCTKSRLVAASGSDFFWCLVLLQPVFFSGCSLLMTGNFCIGTTQQ